MSQIEQGLTSTEAARRLAADGPNELPSNGPRSVVSLAFGVITEPMFLLLLAAATVYLILGDVREALVLLTSVVVIIITTVLQERRTENTLAKLRDLASPRALVIRDGTARHIAGRDVVVGDIVMLQEGDRVPADGIVLTASALSVDESILTGESLPVDKMSVPTKDGDSNTRVYSGSMIVRGYGTAEIAATGARSEIGKIGQALQQLKPEPTPLHREVSHLAKWVAIVGLMLCIAITLVYSLTRGAWLAGVLAGITVAMGVLPEEFPVVLTVFLAMGAWRISKHRVLVRRMPSIESIGAATVLAVDKTGTLTENRMRVAVLDTLDNVFDLRTHDAHLDQSARDLLSTAAAASERDAFDPMEHAIHEATASLAAAEAQRLAQASLIHEYDLTPQLLAVTHVWRADDGALEVVTKGAPETICELCRIGDHSQREALLTRVAQYAQQGLRVLAVARGNHTGELMPDSPQVFSLQLLGLLCLADPIRETVPAALANCKRAGIRVIMITGDHMGTALAIAQQAGFDISGGAVNCAEFNELSDAQLQQRAQHINIYARATPTHKLRLVQALKANGEVIAMTGDGVNDAPALKAAHIGVAMGKRGTDVAREAASLVLLDDDFASLVRAVRLGRRIYTNIQHAMYYIVAVHIPIAGMGLLPVLFNWPLLLYPVHVVFMEFVIDPACSFVFEADEAANSMTQKPRTRDARMFSPRSLRSSATLGLIAFAFASVVYGFALRHLHEAQARALAFAALVLGNVTLMLLSRIQTESLQTILRRPNPAFWGIVITTLFALGAVIYIPPIASLFRFEIPPSLSIAALISVALAGIGLHEAWRRLHASAAR